MKITRRIFLHLSASAAALQAAPRIAKAQSYPSRPVRIIVGFGPGGISDISARLIAHWLSERLGQQFVVENRPGAGANIATEAVVRAAPDGYTLLLTTGTNAFNHTLYERLSFDFVRDIAPVAGLLRTCGVMEVHPSFPAKTVPEFIAYAKTNPGKINLAAVGVGSGSHLNGELFKKMAGVDMVTVQYRGPASALTDLLSGQVQAMFDYPVSSIEHIRAGRLRAIAVTSAVRFEGLPDVPTVGEFVPGYATDVWQGLGAPHDTPEEIIERLNEEINAALVDPQIRARLADLGAMPFPMKPSQLGRFVADEVEKWGNVIRAAGIKAD